MSTIEESDRLSGDYRWLWEIVFSTKRRICQSNGCGEVETIGWEPCEIKYHIIAPTEALARVTWYHRYGYRDDNRLLTCTKMLRVDDEISINGSRA